MSEPEKRPSSYVAQANNTCLQCGASGQLRKHHLDWNHDNNDPGNVVKLCETCHAYINRDAGYLTRDDIIRNRQWIDKQDPTHSRRDRVELMWQGKKNLVEGQMDLFD